MNFLASNLLRYYATPGQTTHIEFEGEIRNDTSSELHFFKAASTSSDALAHVRDIGVAEQQQTQLGTEKFRVSPGLVGGPTRIVFSDSSQSVSKFLFEAAGNILRGDSDGVLNPTLVFRAKITYPNGRIVRREREIKLQLRDITAFYTRREIPYLSNGTDLRKDLGFEHFGDSIVTGTSKVLSTPFLSGDEKIVHAHGWDMSPEWKKAFGTTAFKRLYWQGFRGEFITFDWPTYNNAEVPNIAPIEALANTYNASEFQALRSGQSLMHYLSSLDASKTHLLAHSMGNIVAAEALRLWSQSSSQPLVKNYAALEAAISAGAYGMTSPPAQSALDVDLGPMISSPISIPV